MNFFFIALLFSTAHGLERLLSYSNHSFCESYNISTNYLKAEGPHDTLHYLWDFTRRPTLFLAATDTNVNFSINCDDFAAGVEYSFNFTKTPKYEFFLILNALIEFNDVNDIGILTTETSQFSYKTENFEWEVSENLTGAKDGKSVSLSMTGRNYNDGLHTLSGNFTIQLTAFGFENHDFQLPRLLHSPNSTQCKIILENLESNSGFNESRFAVEMIMVNRETSRDSPSKIVMRKNLDDENSPGIFSMVDVVTPKAQNQQFRGAFLQWRPIIYVTKVASIGNSTELVTYNLTNVTNFEESMLKSLPFKYYGYELNDHLIERTIVSFGTVQDGFYKKTNYSSWTFLLNFGSPEEEKFSLLVILIMCIGLGLPALLILAGGTYMCAKRIGKNKDDLFSER